MTDAHRFLTDLTVVLGTAAVTTVLAQRLKLPVVFGYLVAGLLVGPHLPFPLVATVDTVQTLAELGVILLMFALGLEFRLRRVASVAATSGLPALAETSVMFALGYGVAAAFGWSVAERIVAGALVAISSTTIVTRTFDELRERGRVADLVFGILIVEDLVAILLIVLVGTVGTADRSLLGTLVQLALFLLLVLGVGLAIVPRVVRSVVALRRPETTLVLAVGLCFLGAWVAQQAGYSVALGAFLVGSLVAESGEAHRVETLVHPVRDLFVAIFFVSVGMLIDPRVLAAQWSAVVAFIALVVVGKVVAVSLGTLLGGQSLRDAMRAGMSLAQIGEFSFIIAGAAVATGRVRDFLYPLAVAVSAVTTLATPLLIRSSERVTMRVEAALPHAVQTLLALYASWIERIRSSTAGPSSAITRALGLLVIDAALVALLVIGVALRGDTFVASLAPRLPGGTTAARILIGAIAVVLAVPPLVGAVRTAGVLARSLADRALPAGGAGRLDHARAPRDALVVALHVTIVVMLGVPLVATLEPVLPSRSALVLLAALVGALGVAFWRVARRLQAHATAGAEVIVLALQQQVARGGTLDDLQHTMSRVTRVLPGLGEPVMLRLPSDAVAAGRTLRELNIRGLTGATILGITRDGEASIALPTGRTVLHGGDMLALAGSSSAVDQARTLLEARAVTATAS
ncbi:MAG: cation:proton antiporter [Gemmatimonadaceae bacterium]|nr:cation:proton antiporter [Gemmatimonadaceae bacterium]